MKKKVAEIFIFAGLLLSFAVQVRGDATVYWDSDNGFYPSTVVIGPGEVVTWWNYDPYGFDVQVTFDNSLSFQLVDYSGQAVMFPSTAGYYHYQSNWGDSGAVIVNLPPSVNITNPLNNGVFTAPATFTIQVTASDTPGDSIHDVQFFLGSGGSTNLLGDVSSLPFTMSVTNLAPGNYILIAVATDSYGAQATNVVTFTVLGAAVKLNSPRLSGGNFLFDVTGLASGKTNMMQTSTNLFSWQSTRTNIAAGTAMTITNTPALGAHFYRILQLP